jgi:hypothetical protein
VEPPDAEIEDEPDAAVEAACDLEADFGEPVEIAEVNDVDDTWTGTISADELSLYVSREAPNNRLFLARRDSIDEAFGEPEEQTALNDDIYSTFVSGISADGRMIFVYTDRFSQVAANWDIGISERDSTAAAWGEVQLAGSINTDGMGDCCAYLSDDGETLYLQHATEGLSRAARSGAGGFEAPIRIDELDTGDEWAPVVTADELTIYFTRGDEKKAGNIWVARRSSTADGFGTEELVDELNTPEYDMPFGVSRDGCRLYFVSNGYDTTGDTDVLVAEKPPL